MKYTIEKMQPLTIIDDGKPITKNGYAFIDENGHCIIIVYGESNKDAMAGYLNEKGDRLGIKYKIIDLWQKHES